MKLVVALSAPGCRCSYHDLAVSPRQALVSHAFPTVLFLVSPISVTFSILIDVPRRVKSPPDSFLKVKPSPYSALHRSYLGFPVPE